MNPKVFISHASEDKERFVLEFARRLRDNGIDAWLDKWEMLPGDSLVDRLFEEGLKNASAVIVILSSNSVDKPWVKEELNSAFVKRVNTGSKLIPVILDDCKVPEALKSTLWERIYDVNSYDESFNHIIAGITGTLDKPPLGNLPGYVTSPIVEIGGLARIDNMVLKCVCECALKNGHNIVDGQELQDIVDLSSVPKQELEDSLEMLESHDIFKLTRFIGPMLPSIQISTYGFQQYAKAYIPDYSQTINDVASKIINEGILNNKVIQQQLSKPYLLIDHIFEVLENQGYIEVTKFTGGHIHIYNVTAKFRRAFNT